MILIGNQNSIMVKAHATCPNCKKDWSVSVHEEDLNKFCEGLSIQKAFPYLQPHERELFLSEICPECWDEIFEDE